MAAIGQIGAKGPCYGPQGACVRNEASGAPFIAVEGRSDVGAG